MTGPVDRAVDHHVRDLDLAVDRRLLADHQRAGLAVGRAITLPRTLPSMRRPPVNDDVAVDRGAGADQAVDALLRLVRASWFEHGGLPSGKLKVRVARGAALARLVAPATATAVSAAARRDPERPSTR